MNICDLIASTVYNKELDLLYTPRYPVFRKAVVMRFNVYKWNGRGWEYVATVRADNEQMAANMVAREFNLKGRFASYPHIDTYRDQVTSNSIYTVID